MLSHRHALIINGHGVCFRTNRLIKNAHDGVIFEEVRQLFVVKQVIDRHDFHVIAITDDSKYTSADTAETVYANLNRHYAASLSISTNFLIKSITRWAYPKPLSYQARVLETFSFWTMVAMESKVLE